MKESNRQTWQIELQCPQCGAPLVLEETDRILSCSFCRVRLYLAPEGEPRYYLPPGEKPPAGVLYAPYRRFKGMVFTMDGHGVTERLVDSSLLALRSPCFPFSLGIRPQVLRLRFLAPGTEGRFLSPDFSFPGNPRMNREKAPGMRGNSAGRHAYPAKAFIGETVSLIYAPFVVQEDTLVDAILNAPVPECPETPSEDLPWERDPECRIQFIPLLCPECGWDLDGDKNALVLLCRNCDSAWQAGRRGGFERVACEFIPGPDDASLYLPFWRIRAAIPGARLTSHNDLIRFANLPKRVGDRSEDQAPAFWVPAFKVQPQLFLRLARTLTVSQKSADARDALPPSPRHAVTLPPAEAIESIKVLITALAVQKDLMLSRLSETMITPDEYSLVYCPFVLKGASWTHPSLPVSVSANALSWGKLL